MNMTEEKKVVFKLAAYKIMKKIKEKQV